MARHRGSPGFIASRPLPGGLNTAQEKLNEGIRATRELADLLNGEFDVGTSLLSGTPRPSWRVFRELARQRKQTGQPPSLDAMSEAAGHNPDPIVVKVEIHAASGEPDNLARIAKLAAAAGWRVDFDTQ